MRCASGCGHGLVTRVSSCGGLSGWCAGLWFLASPESLDNAHRATAIGAWFSQCEWGDIGGWWVILLGVVCAEQYPNLCDIGLSLRTRQQTIVTDSVEPIRKHMDKEAPDEFRSGKAHDVLSVAGFNAIVLPSERDGVSIGTDQTAV